ncbi:CrcB family protein [Pseudenhygromyxa sp. WMMC2535]|uniref:fluoride efflux transporter FluC n=1 Tax=Pseudenhygromyxa sp. WMMC2535 TaxID=2712867 RepID=UPI001554DBE7|nr:CrcB family protein [Pseudenhygromyxa sp. WMMC2535]NVB42651.1 CrcB family protein [Pseudenhygromyxa sp. WMMC2535]
MSEPSSEGMGMVAQLGGVFLAGGLGASLRVVLSGRIEQALVEQLPFAGVLLVNLAGCLLIGLASAAITSPDWRNIVLGGGLGGFTTYSAFALFSLSLIESDRWGVLCVQLLAHLVGGVLCVWAGFAIARALGFAASA